MYSPKFHPCYVFCPKCVHLIIIFLQYAYFFIFLWLNLHPLVHLRNVCFSSSNVCVLGHNFCSLCFCCIQSSTSLFVRVDLTKAAFWIVVESSCSQVFVEAMQVKLYAPPRSKLDPSIIVMLLIAIVTVALGGYWSGACERWDIVMVHEEIYIICIVS